MHLQENTIVPMKSEENSSQAKNDFQEIRASTLVPQKIMASNVSLNELRLHTNHDNQAIIPIL